MTALVAEAARLRPSCSGDLVMVAHKASLCSLARRIQGLEDEIAELDERIEKLLKAAAPELLSRFGVGPDTAAALLVSAGDNPERLHSEAAWAHLCGVAPIPASSGKSTGRYRLDRGGDRQANSALGRIVMVRIAHDPETTAYFERKVKEGRSKRDVIRLLKRYVAGALPLSASRANQGRGSGSSPNCCPLGLTFRRLADPRPGTTSLLTRA